MAENPHDKLFKATFSHVDVAREFLQQHVSKDMGQILDVDKLELEKDSHINKALQEGFSDLLFKTHFNGAEDQYFCSKK